LSTAEPEELTFFGCAEEPKTDFQVLSETPQPVTSITASSASAVPKAAEEPTAVNPEEFIEEQKKKQEVPEPAPAPKNMFAEEFMDADADFAMFAPAPEPMSAAKNRRLSISSSFRSKVRETPPAAVAPLPAPVSVPTVSPVLAESAPIAAPVPSELAAPATATETAGASTIVAGLNTKRDEISAEVARTRARLAKLGLLPAGIAATTTAAPAASAAPAPAPVALAVSRAAPAILQPVPEITPAPAAPVVSQTVVPVPAVIPVTEAAPVVEAAATPTVTETALVEEASEESENAADQAVAEEAAEENAEAEGETEPAAEGETETAEPAAEENAEAEAVEEDGKPANLEIYYEAITKLEENFDMILIVHQHLKEQRAKGNVDDLLERFNSLFVKMQERLQVETAHTTFNTAIEAYSTLLVDAVKKKLEKI
jgi:hypothetical protein